MSWSPSFKLYNEANDTLLYTFLVVQYTNAPQSARRFITTEGIRAKGMLVMDAGEQAWDLIIRGILTGTDYQNLMSKIETLENTVEVNTKYNIRIDKTPSTYYNYKVKRIVPIIYKDSLRIYDQSYEIILKTNTW